MNSHTLIVSRRGDAARRAALALASTLAMTAAIMAGAPPPAPAAAARTPTLAGLALIPATSGPGAMKAACPAAPPGNERCLAWYAPQAAVNAALAAGASGPEASPAGWGARDIERAYELPADRNSRQTVAVSIAFDTPRLAQYLAVYRKQYGLPACATTDGCLRVVNQHGRLRPLPSSGVHRGWDLEATLDVSMISAACPHCKILVVEASSPSVGDLAATENTAARLGAQVISNSYGQRENGFALAAARAYNHPGHIIVASSGDLGFTATSFPADLGSVTAVGGTQLARARGSRRWRETVWNDQSGASGSGCSAYVPKPGWQHDRHCGMRAAADVAAVAANIPVYNKDYGGWVTVAGTSIAAPLIAGVYGLAGNAAKIKPGYPYRHASGLFDITAGSNDWLNGTSGAACGHDYLCVARKGYDAPTGLGSPNGTSAF